MKIEELRTYKKILILGYGIEGQATERFIKKFHPKAEIGIGDQKDDPHYLDMQKDYDLAIRTPLLRPKHLKIPYTTGTSLFFANTQSKTIGVTGTKGKSTTVKLIESILNKAKIKNTLCGNIGIPMLDMITDGKVDERLFILELSSYQLEDLDYSPNIGCFLNIYEERHNHDDFDEYFEAKTHITLNQHQDDIFFYNGAMPMIAQLAQETHAQTQDFTTIDVSDVLDDVQLDYFTHENNIKAAWSICSYLGAVREHLYEGLKSFKPLPHRLHNVGIFNKITFYDDSQSVHPESTVFALTALDYVDFLLVGGEDRGFDFTSLVNKIVEQSIPHILLFPDTGEKIYNEFSRRSDYKGHIIRVSSMDEALTYVMKNSSGDEVCLLSPGSPSYNMYANAHERAEDFIRTIKKHAEKTHKKTATNKKNSKKSSTEKA